MSMSQELFTTNNCYFVADEATLVTGREEDKEYFVQGETNKSIIVLYIVKRPETWQALLHWIWSKGG